MLANCPPNPDPYTCAPHDCLNGDIDGDGDVDYDDISLFVGALGGTAPRRTFTWDAENRLRAVVPVLPDVGDLRAEFAYDYLGRRTVQTVSSWTGSAWTVVSETKYVWAGWLMLMELDGLSSDAVLRRNTWGLDLAGQMGSVGVPPASLQSAGGIGGLLAVSDANGTPANPNDDLAYVYFYDANGNVGQVFDPATQTVVAHYEYDPYGNVTNDLSGYAYAETNRWRFSTKQFDAATGLGNWGYRYYDPVLGRWMNRDPIGEAGGPNLHAYVGNAPLGLVDPLGQKSTDFHDVFTWGWLICRWKMCTDWRDVASPYWQRFGTEVAVRQKVTLPGMGGWVDITVELLGQLRIEPSLVTWVELSGYTARDFFAGRVGNLCRCWWNKFVEQERECCIGTAFGPGGCVTEERIDQLPDLEKTYGLVTVRMGILDCSCKEPQ